MSSTVNIYGCFDQDQLEAWAGLEIKTFGNTIEPASLGRIFFVVGSLYLFVYLVNRECLCVCVCVCVCASEYF